MAVQWNERTVAHLLRRAGFGATQEEIKFYLDMGQKRAVDYLLNFESIDDSEADRRIAEANFDMKKLNGIAAAWILKMAITKRPLQEKMAFFWHDHFATAIFKVKAEGLMVRQINLFRRFALGNFEAFLLEVSKDPAMIIWLDNFTNKKGQPNENYARELMELFSMGVGNYTEDDVKESARAFTGWTITSKRKNERDEAEFFFDQQQHDFGNKTFLGQTGPFNGDDIVRIIAGQPATSRFITKKLFEFFAYTNPKKKVLDRLAALYLSSNYSIKAVMQEIFNSDEFYSEEAINGLVKSPVEFVVGTLRMLKAQFINQGPQERELVGILNQLGQVLYNPPGVEGWVRGLEWLNTSTLLTRYNYGNSISSNRTGRGFIIDPKVLLNGKSFQMNNEVVNFFLKALGIYDATSATKKQLKKYLTLNDDGSTGSFKLDDATIDKEIRGLIHLIISLPDYQLN
ncbi:MAG: DUF1800 domain-containing protein [Acidobacteriota bacterium]